MYQMTRSFHWVASTGEELINEPPAVVFGWNETLRCFSIYLNVNKKGPLLYFQLLLYRMDMRILLRDTCEWITHAGYCCIWPFSLYSSHYNQPKQQHNVSESQWKEEISFTTVPEATRLKFLIFQHRAYSHSGYCNSEALACIVFQLMGFNVS